MNWEEYKKEHCSDFDKLLAEAHKNHPEELEEARLWVKEFFEELEVIDVEDQKLIDEERETVSGAMMEIISNARSDARGAYDLYDAGYRKLGVKDRYDHQFVLDAQTAMDMLDSPPEPNEKLIELLRMK